MPSGTTRRRVPVGAEITPEGASFRVWAPAHDRVALVLSPGDSERVVPMARESSDGYHSLTLDDARAGTRYAYRLGDDGRDYPDPASRWQPDGPHGASAVVDPAAFAWTDGAWTGVAPDRHVLYEMHVGTFTPEATWAAAATRLPVLADIGITTIEMMPVTEFSGRHGWGYDGVCFYAPHHHYGTPEDLRGFVDRAHALGLAVILDVVYNHAGPDGYYAPVFSRTYESTRHTTDWGAPPNFDDEGCGPVREFFVANARYWIDEFHFDGLRLDATQNVPDTSPRHVLADITRAAREGAGSRRTFVVAENEPQDGRLVRPPEDGGYGMDALWNDDFHHSAVVAATGRHEAYYSDHRGGASEFVAAAKYGYLFQGQRYSWQKQPRGTPCLDLPATAFVHFLENHDQVANSGRGLRLHQQTSPARWRALTALLLLGPQLPMLLQGQEFRSSRPFLFFADHQPELAANVRKGRREFLAQFPSLATPESHSVLADPESPATYEACVLDWNEFDRHQDTVALHRDLLALRREDPVIGGAARRHVDGAPISRSAFVLRYFAAAEDGSRSRSGADVARPRGTPRDRLLIVNLGRQLEAASLPEPLLAPPAGCQWSRRWTSEAPAYGGTGAPPVLSDQGWLVPADSATLLAAWPREEERHA